MFSANAYVIRVARVPDVPELVRLGWAVEKDWPSGPIVIGEIRGIVAAALAIDENRALLADLPGAPRLLAHVRARVTGLQAHDRTPSLTDRIRERMYLAAHAQPLP